MNEAEFSRSIGKIINNRLTKEKAQGEDVAKLFDHPNRNQSEIDRAVRLAVFGRLAGLQDQLFRIHIVNRLFAYWVVFAGLESKQSPWIDIKENALTAMSVLLADHPQCRESVDKAKEKLR
jgi:hypothetical protein